MKGVLFLIVFVSARLPAYQRCLNALANYDGFDGNETITVIFPNNYSKEELEKTVEQLGHLVVYKQFYVDYIAKYDEQDRREQEELLRLRTERKTLEVLCNECQKRIDKKNSELWYWNSKLSYEDCWECSAMSENFRKIDNLAFKGPRGPVPPEIGGNIIKLKVF